MDETLVHACGLEDLDNYPRKPDFYTKFKDADSGLKIDMAVFVRPYLSNFL